MARYRSFVILGKGHPIPKSSAGILYTNFRRTQITFERTRDFVLNNDNLRIIKVAVF